MPLPHSDTRDNNHLRNHKSYFWSMLNDRYRFMHFRIRFDRRVVIDYGWEWVDVRACVCVRCVNAISFWKPYLELIELIVEFPLRWSALSKLPSKWSWSSNVTSIVAVSSKNVLKSEKKQNVPTHTHTHMPQRKREEKKKKIIAIHWNVMWLGTRTKCDHMETICNDQT